MTTDQRVLTSQQVYTECFKWNTMSVQYFSDPGVFFIIIRIYTNLFIRILIAVRNSRNICT